MQNNKKYTTVYFDLDDTLLDFKAAEHDAIEKLLSLHNLPSNDSLIAEYSAINQSWWERFEKGEIKRKQIFSGRFRDFIERFEFTADPEKMATDYFNLLSQGHNVMNGAEDVLKHLKGNGYIICITTNGIAFTQHRRIKECGLQKYFDYVFISEEVGFQKPDKRYFEAVMNNSPEKDKSKILVIGDSQSSDILGGINMGLDTCWLNTHNKTATYIPTYEIKKITEILHILQ